MGADSPGTLGKGGTWGVAGQMLGITCWVAPMWHLAHGSDELKGPVAKTLEKQTKDQLTRLSPPVTHLGKQQV